jgi:Fe-S-cluster containining protein
MSPALPCQSCAGLCCGPVPITANEFVHIKQEIRRRPAGIIIELENQKRYFGTCIFYDLNHNKCGIYTVRPSICSAFGNYKNLICFRNPMAASAINWVVYEAPAGILSVDFTWKDFK